MRGGSGNGPSLAGKLGGAEAFARCAMEGVDRFQCLLRPVPAAEWAGVGWVLRSQGSSGEDGLWRCRAGDEVIASNACSGPFPLLNGRRWDGAFARREAWDTCFAVAECWGWRLGLVGGGGSAGSVLRSQGTLGPVKLSRCRARGIRMSTFLCSLRPDPAAASWKRRTARGC